MVTLLMGLGGLGVLLNMLFGVVELATSGSIRPPEDRTFSDVRRHAERLQSVVLPAFGVLISGLFVSLSASFLFTGLTVAGAEWQPPIGLGLFVVAVVALTIVLNLATTRIGTVEDLTRDPSTIKAAAIAVASDDRTVPVGPDVLRARLDQWEARIGSYSVGISSGRPTKRLAAALGREATHPKVVIEAYRAVVAHLVAVVWFPVQFGWSVAGPVALAVGSVLYGVLDEDMHLERWQPWVGIALFVIVSCVGPLIFYAWARGRSSRRWYRINVESVREARRAIDAAEAAVHRKLVAEDPHTAAGGATERVLLQIGRFRVAIDGRAGGPRAR